MFFDENGSIASPVNLIDKTQRVQKELKDLTFYLYHGEFDPGSGRTLAAGLIHASRTRSFSLLEWKVAHGCVTRRQPTPESGITIGNDG